MSAVSRCALSSCWFYRFSGFKSDGRGPNVHVLRGGRWRCQVSVNAFYSRQRYVLDFYTVCKIVLDSCKNQGQHNVFLCFCVSVFLTWLWQLRVFGGYVLLLKHVCNATSVEICQALWCSCQPVRSIANNVCPTSTFVLHILTLFVSSWYLFFNLLW